MSNLLIRQANVTDIQLIALLARVTFSETFRHYFRDRNDLLNYFNQTFSVEKIKRSILNPNNVFWIAYYNELPVGYAKLKLNSKSEFLPNLNTSQLQKIYVLRDFLSKKFGLELQTVLLERAKNFGSDVIWLSVLQSNTRALKFYKNSGYKKIGEHDFSIGIVNFHFNVLEKSLN